MKIGIISGMREELLGLQPPIAALPSDVPFYCFSGKQKSHQVTGAWAGCGKVAAAMCATMLIERYGAQIIIVTGTAGALQPGLEVTPFVVSAAIQHDYGSQNSVEVIELHRPPLVPLGVKTMEIEFLADGDLVKRALAVEPIDGHYPNAARIATGDQFINCQASAYQMRLNTAAQLVDMETAAVAQVASTYSIPWVGIKAISDNLDQTGFQEGLAEAVRRSTVHTQRLIESLDQ